MLTTTLQGAAETRSGPIGGNAGVIPLGTGTTMSSHRRPRSGNSKESSPLLSRPASGSTRGSSRPSSSFAGPNSGSGEELGPRPGSALLAAAAAVGTAAPHQRLFTSLHKGQLDNMFGTLSTMRVELQGLRHTVSQVPRAVAVILQQFDDYANDSSSSGGSGDASTPGGAALLLAGSPASVGGRARFPQVAANPEEQIFQSMEAYLERISGIVSGSNTVPSPSKRSLLSFQLATITSALLGTSSSSRRTHHMVDEASLHSSEFVGKTNDGHDGSASSSSPPASFEDKQHILAGAHRLALETLNDFQRELDDVELYTATVHEIQGLRRLTADSMLIQHHKTLGVVADALRGMIDTGRRRSTTPVSADMLEASGSFLLSSALDGAQQVLRSLLAADNAGSVAPSNNKPLLSRNPQQKEQLPQVGCPTSTCVMGNVDDPPSRPASAASTNAMRPSISSSGSEEETNTTNDSNVREVDGSTYSISAAGVADTSNIPLSTTYNSPATSTRDETEGGLLMRVAGQEAGEEGAILDDGAWAPPHLHSLVAECAQMLDQWKSLYLAEFARQQEYNNNNNNNDAAIAAENTSSLRNSTSLPASTLMLSMEEVERQWLRPLVIQRLSDIDPTVQAMKLLLFAGDRTATASGGRVTIPRGSPAFRQSQEYLADLSNCGSLWVAHNAKVAEEVLLQYLQTAMEATTALHAATTAEEHAEFVPGPSSSKLHHHCQRGGRGNSQRSRQQHEAHTLHQQNRARLNLSRMRTVTHAYERHKAQSALTVAHFMPEALRFKKRQQEQRGEGAPGAGAPGRMGVPTTDDMALLVESRAAVEQHAAQGIIRSSTRGIAGGGADYGSYSLLPASATVGSRAAKQQVSPSSKMQAGISANMSSLLLQAAGLAGQHGHHHRQTTASSVGMESLSAPPHELQKVQSEVVVTSAAAEEEGGGTVRINGDDPPLPLPPPSAATVTRNALNKWNRGAFSRLVLQHGQIQDRQRKMPGDVPASSASFSADIDAAVGVTAPAMGTEAHSRAHPVQLPSLRRSGSSGGGGRSASLVIRSDPSSQRAKAEGAVVRKKKSSTMATQTPIAAQARSDELDRLRLFANDVHRMVNHMLQGGESTHSPDGSAHHQDLHHHTQHRQSTGNGSLNRLTEQVQHAMTTLGQTHSQLLSHKHLRGGPRTMVSRGGGDAHPPDGRQGADGEESRPSSYLPYRAQTPAGGSTVVAYYDDEQRPSQPPRPLSQQGGGGLSSLWAGADGKRTKMLGGAGSASTGQLRKGPSPFATAHRVPTPNLQQKGGGKPGSSVGVRVLPTTHASPSGPSVLGQQTFTQGYVNGEGSGGGPSSSPSSSPTKLIRVPGHNSNISPSFNPPTHVVSVAAATNKPPSQLWVGNSGGRLTSDQNYPNRDTGGKRITCTRNASAATQKPSNTTNFSTPRLTEEQQAGDGYDSTGRRSREGKETSSANGMLLESMGSPFKGRGRAK